MCYLGDVVGLDSTRLTRRQSQSLPPRSGPKPGFKVIIGGEPVPQLKGRLESRAKLPWTSRCQVSIMTIGIISTISRMRTQASPFVIPRHTGKPAPDLHIVPDGCVSLAPMPAFCTRSRCRCGSTHPCSARSSSPLPGSDEVHPILHFFSEDDNLVLLFCVSQLPSHPLRPINHSYPQDGHHQTEEDR
jgi:hypothetical protein